jgi:hypothetical protein
MPRTIRLVMLVAAVSPLAACSQGSMIPTEPSKPAAAAVKDAPTKANADDECDLIRPWTCS